MTALFLASLFATPAQACGGFFCNSAQPVIQNAERIVFAMDGEEIEAHVQIFYEGPADEFAWIVPVPDNPELFLSTDALFNTLSLQTAPLFQLNIVEEGRCASGVSFNKSTDFAVPQAGGSYDDGVDVISQSQVGPYDTAVLKASSSADLLTWLNDSGYDLPPDLQPLLDPYVSNNSHFLALKLSKNKDTGDIAPIGFRYAGTQPSVPIQLTSVAAAPDMRLETYVFANERVVPESYLHVQINDAAVDWWNFGQNYPDVITKAANEAGGHAFATDFAGSPSSMQGFVYREGQFDVAGLRNASSAQEWLEMLNQQMAATSTLLDIIDAYVDVPAGVSTADFFGCPSCYSGWNPLDFDPQAATDDLEALVIAPMRTAEDLFHDYPMLSRMTSSLDAVEMTVDPVFVENPDMGDVSNAHSADLVYECNGRKREKALRRLVLEDGREIVLPSENWFADNNTTEFEFIEALGEINAQIIEETGASGKPKVLNDHTGALFDQTEAFNEATMKMLRSCGCSSSGGPTGGLLGLGLLAIVMRRRH